MAETLTAALFPGQGSQTAAMRATVERSRPELIELAARAAGGDPFARLDEGTRFQQPALLCASLAAWSERGERAPDLAAGHSLGEFAALVAAGALAPDDGVRLVALRGRLMQEAAERDPGGGMLAVVGAEPGDARALAGRHGLTLANDNAPRQAVLSGAGAGLAEAEREARALPGVRAVRLAVAGAFHSPAMEPAVEPFAAALAATPFAEPRVPVVSCVTARPFDDVRARLAEALTHGVRWRETLAALHARGARRFVESGPGRVLTGLVRRTLAGVEAHSIDGPEPGRG